jgi:hypothetical protein
VTKRALSLTHQAQVACRKRQRPLALLVAVALLLLSFGSLPASATPASALKRYPYLSDVTATSAVVNWGTDRSSISGTLTWGLPGSSCNAHSAAATRIGITVNGAPEYQWAARATGLGASTSYCYRIYLGASNQTNLLSTDMSPIMRTLPKATPGAYTFAVLGDWGQSSSNGNSHQSALLTQLKNSAPRFVVFAGDTAYPAGTQTNYGDLISTGNTVSGVFGPTFWAKVGARMPVYATIGNHAPNSTFLANWPENSVAAASDGRWAMESYPSVNGSAARAYPSAWYAFNIGADRYYVLDATWDDSNLGSGTAYADDYAAHWKSTSAEYKWLAADLAAHPGGLKMAFFHYPLYSDQSTEQSDTHLQGSQSLEGLLAKHHVDIAFNGHAHVYERNLKPSASGLVSYVTGGGGATLQSMGGFGCSAFNAYGIGWKASTNDGSACGAAPTPQAISSVYHFLLVSVDGAAVTVRGVTETGARFDPRTYDFSADGAGRPSAPRNVTASYDAPEAVVTWDPGTDDIGVNSYKIFRDGVQVATARSYHSTYVDSTAPTGTTVSYSVQAVDGDGLSSLRATATPLAIPV